MRKIVAENSKLIEEKKIEDNIRKVEKKNCKENLKIKTEIILVTGQK